MLISQMTLDVKAMVDHMLRKAPELTIDKLKSLIAEKQKKIGAGYLTEQGALFLVAADYGIDFDEVRPKSPPIKSTSAAIEILEELKKLQKEFTETKDKITNDSIIQLQRKIFQNEVEEIMNYIKQTPEFQELLLFTQVIELSKLMGTDLRWCLAATSLSLLEWYLKTWLIRNSENSLDSLQGNNIDMLIAKIEDTLKVKKVEYGQLILSDLVGKRHFRNRVIHDLTTPTDSELAEITSRIKEFVNYMESISHK